MAPSSVLFPTPLPPYNPIRWPRPQGSKLSIARIPVTRGSVMCSRSMGPGGVPNRSYFATGSSGGPPSIGRPKPSSTRPADPVPRRHAHLRRGHTWHRRVPGHRSLRAVWKEYVRCENRQPGSGHVGHARSESRRTHQWPMPGPGFDQESRDIGHDTAPAQRIDPREVGIITIERYGRHRATLLTKSSDPRSHAEFPEVVFRRRRRGRRARFQTDTSCGEGRVRHNLDGGGVWQTLEGCTHSSSARGIHAHANDLAILQLL